jgi:hypothetical protein
MYVPTEPLNFPNLSDEAVIAINDFIEEIYMRFQNHYFAQMYRYDQQRHHPSHPLPRQLPLPLTVPQPSDPPF